MDRNRNYADALGGRRSRVHSLMAKAQAAARLVVGLLLPIILVVAAAGIAPASAQTPIGTAVSVRPMAFGDLDGNQAQLADGSSLYVGQTISTDISGQVTIVFTDQTQMVVRANSTLVLETYLLRDPTTVSNFAVNALGGAYRFVSGNSPSSAYTINTPTGTIGSRGTIINFVIDPETGELVEIEFEEGTGYFCPSDAVSFSDCELYDTDSDLDGVSDTDDNCIDTPNPDQSDSDEDGVGDACDDFQDNDNDTVANEFDNCIDTPNTNQLDVDGDGIGDVCDDLIDNDDDSIANSDDNCIDTPNTDQIDVDEDGVGDACDDLIDNDDDGVANDVDNCIDTPNSDQIDIDEDNIGDACDDEIDDGEGECEHEGPPHHYSLLAIEVRYAWLGQPPKLA